MSETVTIDKAGRLIIPKKVRERLGLKSGDKLKIDVVGERIELEAQGDETKVEIRNGRRVIVGTGDVDVVKAIEATREEQVERILDYQKK